MGTRDLLWVGNGRVESNSTCRTCNFFFSQTSFENIATSPATKESFFFFRSPRTTWRSGDQEKGRASGRMPDMYLLLPGECGLIHGHLVFGRQIAGVEARNSSVDNSQNFPEKLKKGLLPVRSLATDKDLEHKPEDLCVQPRQQRSTATERIRNDQVRRPLEWIAASRTAPMTALGRRAHHL